MQRFACVLFLLFLSVFTYAQTDTTEIKFQDYFRYGTLRFDFNLGGDYQSEAVFPIQFKHEPFWGSPMKHLVDPFNYGTYRVVVKDSASGRIIYTKGFANLFQEWQGTPDARKNHRTYYQVVTCPYPIATILLAIEKREYETGNFRSLYTTYVNPENKYISKESPVYFPSVKFRDSGSPPDKLDIAFLAEGYTLKEMDKFREDSKRMATEILKMKPYSEYKDKINFYEVESVSQESGVDIPGEDIYFNTDFNSTFYTFETDRYLTTSDMKSVYDAAANVPYDAIIILVNSKKYGGGGFYNQYAETTVDNDYSPQVLVHEFGHSFAGLADEYVGSVSYSDFYNTKVEPWEPNITTNIRFDSKWKNMIKKGTPVPTPRTPDYEKATGMFMGGGYVSTGVYSPAMDCRMNTNEAPGFCEVCRQAITKMILFYCE